MMVRNWKSNYLEYATPEGNNDFLLEEFQEEITTYMSPYLRRLYQCEYLTDGRGGSVPRLHAGNQVGRSPRPD